MVRVLSMLAAVLLVSAAPSCRAQTAVPQFQVSFIGEGEVPYAPSPEQENFQQNWGQYGTHNSPDVGLGASLPNGAPGLTPQTGTGAGSAAPSSPAPVQRPAVPPGGTQVSGPQPAPAQRTRRLPAPLEGLLGFFRVSRPKAERSAAASREAAPSDGLRDAPAGAPQGFPLWRGLNAPLGLPAGKVGDASPEGADAQGRADYARHILGAQASAGDPAAPPAAPAPLDRSLPPGADAHGLFVAVELDLAKSPGEYRDALAEVSRASGFSVDGRFPPAFRDEGRKRVALRGWLAPERFGDALRVPSVTRLETDRGAAPRPQPAAPTRVIVSLRLPRSAAAPEAFSSALLRLSTRTGFAWKRTLGYRDLPGRSEEALVVAGDLPLRRMERLMSDPAVLNVEPLTAAALSGFSPGVQEASAGPSLPRAALAVVDRHPILLLLTLLLTAFLLGPRAEPFVPYRR